MNALVRDFNGHVGTNTIDMLCISHFDGDHVNGLKELLSVFSIKHLFLPYLPLSKRLEIVCKLDLDAVGSTEAMLFTLDPPGFLANRDLVNRVQQIVYVRGGEQGGDNPSIDIEDLPKNSFSSEDKSKIENQGKNDSADGEYAPIFTEGWRISTSTVSHSTPLTLHMKLWEFVFYNKELPSGVTSKSGKFLAEVQEDIKEILVKWDLISGPPKDVEGWRKDLRECYSKHFGSRSKERNDISLCLYSAPLEPFIHRQCSIYSSPRSSLGSAHTHISIASSGATGLLLTGDISLDATELGKMESHFTPSRWANIHVMQIPHHGSRHSWQFGNAEYCKHQYSIFCVPNFDKSRNHPSESVVEDLKDKNPLFANYSNSVVYCFHTITKRDRRGLSGAAVFF